MYCNSCYNQLFGQKGFGFGGGGGTLSSYRPGHANPSEVEVDKRPLAEQQVEPETPKAAAPAPEAAPEAAPAPASPTTGPKFCSECGSPCAGMKFCSNCGHPCQ